MLNVNLQDNYFSDLFIEIQVRQQMNFKFGPGYIFRKIGAVNKDIKRKEIFADNHRNNILRLLDTLPNLLFTTSETKHDY